MRVWALVHTTVNCTCTNLYANMKRAHNVSRESRHRHGWNSNFVSFVLVFIFTWMLNVKAWERVRLPWTALTVVIKMLALIKAMATAHTNFPIIVVYFHLLFELYGFWLIVFKIVNARGYETHIRTPPKCARKHPNTLLHARNWSEAIVQHSVKHRPEHWSI